MAFLDCRLDPGEKVGRSTQLQSLSIANAGSILQNPIPMPRAAKSKQASTVRNETQEILADQNFRKHLVRLKTGKVRYVDATTGKALGKD